MAFVSSSVDLWNPYKVLDVYPNSAKSSCVGVRNGTEVRCGWRLVPNDQFSASQLAVAAKQLRSMAAKHPSDVTSTEIRALVQNTLCGFHQWQTSTVEGKWETEIHDFVHEHSGMLETHRAVKHSQSEVAEEADKFDLNEVKKACVALEASQARCTELTEKTDKLEKDQAASSQNLALLRRHMAELQTDTKTRDELDTKVERLKTQMKEKHADLEKNAAAGSKETQRLRNGNAQLSSMMTTNNLELASLKAKVRDRDRALDERAKRSEEDAQDLRRQLDASGHEVQLLKEAKASLEERANRSEREAEILRQSFQKSDARHAALETRSSESSKQLGERLDALEQKYNEGRDENSAQIERVREEQESRIEELVTQLEVVQRDSADRGPRVERLVEGLRLDLTKRDQRVEELTNHLDMMRRDSVERDRRVEELVKQMETSRRVHAERDRHVQQLGEQMAVLKQEISEREVRRIPLHYQLDG